LRPYPIEGYDPSMKRTFSAALLCILTIAVWLSCSSGGQEITVVGEKKEIGELAGLWQGTYDSDDGARTGTIELRFEGDTKTASGNVVMSASDNPDAALHLRIRFVQIAEGWISGRLDPYQDPECDCMVESLFQGRLAGDSMVGTYSTRGVAEEFLRTGSWVMTRSSSDGAAVDSTPKS